MNDNDKNITSHLAGSFGAVGSVYCKTEQMLTTVSFDTADTQTTVFPPRMLPTSVQELTGGDRLFLDDAEFFRIWGVTRDGFVGRGSNGVRHFVGKWTVSDWLEDPRMKIVKGTRG